MAFHRYLAGGGAKPATIIAVQANVSVKLCSNLNLYSPKAQRRTQKKRGSSRVSVAFTVLVSQRHGCLARRPTKSKGYNRVIHLHQNPPPLFGESGLLRLAPSNNPRSRYLFPPRRLYLRMHLRMLWRQDQRKASSDASDALAMARRQQCSRPRATHAVIHPAAAFARCSTIDD